LNFHQETKDKNAIAPQLERKSATEKRVAELKLQVKQHKKTLNEKLWVVGNLVHESVPVSMTEVNDFSQSIFILDIF
jgi:seryl-tRNA synthetase